MSVSCYRRLDFLEDLEDLEALDCLDYLEVLERLEILDYLERLERLLDGDFLGRGAAVDVDAHEIDARGCL